MTNKQSKQPENFEENRQGSLWDSLPEEEPMQQSPGTIPLKPDNEHFTDKQWQAVFDGGDNLLVSASAGSGKTTVLVRRVIEKLKSGTNVDELLIVTFTEAAAREMKERIQRALSDALSKESDPKLQAHYAHQLTLLPQANISTLHAFCLTVIRRFYFLIGIDPVFRMLTDETETLLLKEEVWEELRESYYAAEDALFYQLVENFSNDRSDEGLTNLVMRLYLFAVANPDPEGWLAALPESYETKLPFQENPLYQKQLKPQLVANLALALAEYQQALHLAESQVAFNNYLTKLQEELPQLQRLADALQEDRVEDFYLQLSSLALDSRLVAKRNENKELSQELLAHRKAGKEQIAVLKELMPYSPADSQTLMALAQPLVAKLAQLTSDFLQNYRNRKLAKGLLDFNDLEHYTLQILQGTSADQPGASSYYRQKFAEVMVDEYQDVNRLQEAILYYVRQVDPTSHEERLGNMFMVGDVKQSIYAFRLADPTLFIDKYLAFGDQDGGRRIILAENFRSRHEVLDFTNLVFKQLMDPAVGQIAYDEAAALIPAFPDFPEVPGFETELLIYEKGEPRSSQQIENKTQGELLLTAAKIRQLMTEGFQVYDKKKQSLRPIEYRDIVLLTPTKTKNEEIITCFQQLNIPLEISDAENYFQTTEIQTMISLLTIIDNPDNDIPLAAVLRSPIVGLTEPELGQIRVAEKQGSFYQALLAYGQVGEAQLQEKVTAFLAQLTTWRDLSKVRSIPELLWQIYDDTGYLDHVLAMAVGRQRYANLIALVDRAQTYEGSSFRGLYKFIRMVERMQEKQVDLAKPLATPVENAVRVMTIHGSKGLEFPVVFVMDMSREMSQQDFQTRYLFEEKLGAGIKYLEPETRVEYETLPYQALLQVRRQKAYSEEMRKLYVALTRAEQKLFLVGSYKDQAEAGKKWQQASNQTEVVLNPALRMQAANVLMNWVGRTLWRHPQMTTYFPEAADRALTVEAPVDFEISFYDEAQVISWVTTLQAQKVTEETGDAAMQSPQDALRVKEQQQLEGEFQRLKQRLDYQYPHEKATKTTSYQSVSEIKRMFDDPDNSDEARIDWLSVEEQETNRRYRFTETELPKPAFLEETSVAGSQVGSATHLFLQLWPLDLEPSADHLQGFADKLVKHRLLTPELAARIDFAAVAWFLTGTLGQKMRENPENVHREQPFAMLKEAREIFREYDATQDELLIHGIIDGYIEEANQIYLYDFKTDFVLSGSEEVMQERYQGQLTLYKQALEQALGKPVTTTALVWLAERKILNL